MAVHRLTTPSPPTSPRRSPRLGLPTRKRARLSDSDQQLTPSSSKLTLTPDPSPRWIRANKRQKILDASPPPLPTTTTTPNVNGSKRAGKRKLLSPNDHHELDSHHIVRKKRKENIVNDAPTANASTSSLKISVTQDTRLGGGNNNTGQSQSLKMTRNTRSMTRTMKKSSPDVQARVDSSPPPDSTSRSHVLKSNLPPTSASSLTIPTTVISHPTDTKSAIPTNDVVSTTTTTGDITNDAQPSIQSLTTSNCTTPDSTPLPLSKSPLEISTSLIMPLPISISSLPMSFMNVPLSMPLNLAFMNMPLSMPLSMPLNIPISTDISTTLAPSESELGFGFQPQEEFSSTGREEDQGKGNGEDGKGGREGEHVFPQQLSTPPLLSPARSTTNESTTTRSSSDIFLDCPPSPPPPQSCTPSLSPSSTTPTRIPPRLAISTCLPDQTPSTSTSTSSTSPTSTSPTSYSFINSTSPTHSSPLKAVCFPSLPVPPQQQHERQMKEWAMDMADERQTERALEQEMGIDLSLSFRDSSTGQEDGLRLAPQALEEERSPLLGPVPQPSSSQPPDPYPQLDPPFPSCPPSPACCSSSSSNASSSRQYHKKVEYQHHQIPEWTPKLDKERNLWKLACKIRVWEITKRYTPDTIRTVVAQEAHDYYSAHGFPLGYGSAPVKSRKRRWRRKIATATAGSDSDCASSMVSTPSLSPPSPRDDEFMSEETYSFELMDDDDDMEGSVNGSVGSIGGLRSMEDEWRYEGFEDEEYEYEDEDEDDEDDDDLYDDDDDDDEMEEVVEGDEDLTKMTGNRKKKGDVSFITGEDQDQDPDAEGEMEIDIEPFQDPSFNAELSSPTSPTSPSMSSKLKSKSKSNSGVGDETQSYVSSFYIPTVSPHVQHMMQMQQQQQQQQEEEVPPAALAPSSLDSSSNSDSSSSPPLDTVDHSTSPTPNNEVNHTPMQIHLPPAPHHPHHYPSQFIQLSSNILPLPPPRLDSVRVFILRQSEMGGLKTTGRGTPADRKRGAIWCGVQIGDRDVGTTRRNNKRGLDDGKESESESDDESGEDDEGGKRGRPRLRLMLSDHDIETGPRSGGNREGESGDGVNKTSLRHKPSSSSSSSSSSTFVATDQTWDAFLASLDDKNHQQPQQPPQQQQGELLLDLDDGHHLLSNQQHRLHRERDSPPPPLPITTTTTTITARRLGPSLSPTSSLEGSSGMFIFDHRDEDEDDDDSTSRWFGDDDEGGGGLGGRRRRRSSNSGLVVVGSSSSGTCPSDALAMEGFNFPDGSSTLSYALG